MTLPAPGLLSVTTKEGCFGPFESIVSPLHLCSHCPSPCPPPGPASLRVFLPPVSFPSSNLHAKEPETQISPCHPHIHNAFLSHLPLDVRTFHVLGPVCHLSSTFPAKCTKISHQAVFAHDVPSKRTQISPLQGHLPCLSSVSPAPNASLHCNTYPVSMVASPREGMGP